MAQANAPALPWIRRQGDQPDENHREQRRTHPALIALGVSTAILAVLALIFFLSAAAWKDDAVKGGQDVATAKAAEKAAKAKTVEWEKYAGQLEQKVKTAEGARDEWKNTARERGISLATVEKERDGLRSKLAAAQKARTATAGAPPDLNLPARTWKTGTTADGGSFRHNCYEGIERPLIPTFAQVGAGNSAGIRCERIASK